MQTNPKVSPCSATAPTERQEIVLQDVFTDCPLTLSRERDDLVRLTYGGISRTTDIDASDLLLAAQMLARDSQADADKEILRDIMSYSNGTLTTNAFLQRIKVILAPAAKTGSEEAGERGSEVGPHSAKLYRLLDQVAAQRVRQRAQILAEPLIEIDLANPRTDPDTKLRIMTIGLGDIATTVDVMDLTSNDPHAGHRPELLRAELAEKLIQLAAHALAWVESIPEEPTEAA